MNPEYVTVFFESFAKKGSRHKKVFDNCSGVHKNYEKIQYV